MERRRLVERDDAECLQAARPLHGLDHDAGTLVGGLVAVPAQARDVEEHVRHAVVGNDEPEALADVEPLDAAADLDEIERLARHLSPKGLTTLAVAGHRPSGP